MLEQLASLKENGDQVAEEILTTVTRFKRLIEIAQIMP
jgi:hypothetical protein